MSFVRGSTTAKMVVLLLLTMEEQPVHDRACFSSWVHLQIYFPENILTQTNILPSQRLNILPKE